MRERHREQHIVHPPASAEEPVRSWRPPVEARATPCAGCPTRTPAAPSRARVIASALAIGITGYSIGAIMGLAAGSPAPFEIGHAILGGCVFAVLLGAGLGKITLNLKGDYFCIATLGVGEAIRLIFNNLQLTINVGGKDFLLDGAKGVASIPLKTTLFGDWNALSNGDVGTFLSTLFSSALFIVIIFLTATALLMNSKHGRSMLAVREDELAAQMSGINTFRSKMLAMCMSALYAAIAGAMMAHYFGYLQPKMFLMTKSTEYTIMVIFGGMGSITGSVLGTVLLCALPELLRAVGDWRLVMYGLAVIVISSEMEEMLRCCNRMYVLRDKQIVAELSGDEISESRIMEIIAGEGASAS